MKKITLLFSILLAACGTEPHEILILEKDTKKQEQVTKERKEDPEFQRIAKMAAEGHKRVKYADAWEALKVIDGAGKDKVRLIYSRELRDSDLHSKPIKGEWNREHVFCASYGLARSGIDHDDLHNLFAIDKRTNSSRGNKLFGDGDDEWMPPTEIRGDIARVIFYMAVRYNGNDKYTTDLKVAESADIENQTFGNLSTLLKWNEEDAVSEEEKARNEAVADIQGNRNPFVDNPLLVKVFKN